MRCEEATFAATSELTSELTSGLTKLWTYLLYIHMPSCTNELIASEYLAHQDTEERCVEI